MSSNQSQASSAIKANTLSPFSGDKLSENDIEQIWKNFIKTSKKEQRNSITQLKSMGTSVETTPTTDYGDRYFPLHPETEEEVLEQDKRIVKMNTVLKAKRLHPKSYLPQVILYDNMSHERMLSMKLTELRNAHQAVERRAKRQEESFVKSLERKQQDWMKRDERIIAKLEPQNLSEFNFNFGRLYSKPDYPYQTIVQASHNNHPSSRKLDHARTRPLLLPQLTNRPIYDDEEMDKTFITKLPKYHVSERTQDTNEGMAYFPNRSKMMTGYTRRNPGFSKSTRPTDWTKDKRFHTLTDLLGERYSPKRNERQQKAARNNSIILTKLV